MKASRGGPRLEGGAHITGAESAKQVKSATAIGNDANLDHLQVIRFYEEIMARPTRQFFLEQAATVRNVGMLESREI